MITKLILRNWRSHSNSELKFENGTNALLGHIGAGKTSILHAVCFALFGSFPSLQNRKLKLDDIIMRKPVAQNLSEVNLEFNFNGNNYFVKRVIEKGKGTMHSELRENGKVIEMPSASRVTEQVEKILKVDYDLFSKAIYSEQNALDYFLTIAKGSRMKKIDELLMIDKFEKARANSVSLANKFSERKLGKQSIVDHVNIDLLEKNVESLKNSLSDLLAEKKSLQIELSNAVSAKAKIESELRELQAIKENFELVSRQEEGVMRALQENVVYISNLEKAVQKLDKETVEKNLKELTKFLADLERVIAENEETHDKLQKQVERSNAEVEFIRKEKLQILEKQFNEKLRIKKEFENMKSEIGDNIEGQLEEQKKVLEKFVGDMEAIRIKVNDLQDTVKQISSLGGKCPICESRLTKEKKSILIKQKQQQVKALIQSMEKAKEKKQITERELKQLEGAAKKLDEMILEIRDLDEIKFEFDNTQAMHAVLSESSGKLEKELRSLKNELENMHAKMKQFTNDKQKFEILLDKVADYEDRRKRIAELGSQRESIMRHVDELKKKLADKDIKTQDELLKKLIAKEREMIARIDGLEQMSGEKEKRLKDFSNSLDAAKTDLEEIKRLDKLVQELKIFEKALQQTQQELRTEFVTSVNYTMAKIWETLYPYQDFSGIKLAVEEGDYVLQLQDKSGNWNNVEGFASGGERNIACLALRIAFALVLAPHLKILILDEPTANMDKQAVLELATTLRERIGEFIDQTFLITHQEELEEAVNGSAYKLERDKANDGATKVFLLS